MSFSILIQRRKSWESVGWEVYRYILQGMARSSRSESLYIFSRTVVGQIVSRGENGEELLVGSIYRSPSSDEYESIQGLGNLLEAVVQQKPKKTQLIVCGDYNLKGINWENEVCEPQASRALHTFLSKIQDLCYISMWHSQEGGKLALFESIMKKLVEKYVQQKKPPRKKRNIYMTEEALKLRKKRRNGYGKSIFKQQEAQIMPYMLMLGTNLEVWPETWRETLKGI